MSPLRGTTGKANRLRKVIPPRPHESRSLRVSRRRPPSWRSTSPGSPVCGRNSSRVPGQNRINLTFMPFFSLAAVEALKTFPQVQRLAGHHQRAQSTTGRASRHCSGFRTRPAVPVVSRRQRSQPRSRLAIADARGTLFPQQQSPDDLSGGTLHLDQHRKPWGAVHTPSSTGHQVAILGTGAVGKLAVRGH